MMAQRWRTITLSRKIYALISFSFVGLLGIAILDSRELASSLKQQKQIELQHLTELALGIVKEEYAAAEKGGIAVGEAQKRALARVAALRYGNNDYFVVQDMVPRVLMHPFTPQLVGRDMSDMKDPTGKPFSAEMRDLVKQKGSGFVDYVWARPGIGQAAAETVLHRGGSRPGTGRS